jgi:hypothetical protein
MSIFRLDSFFNSVHTLGQEIDILAEAQFLVPDCGIGLSYKPVRLHFVCLWRIHNCKLISPFLR